MGAFAQNNFYYYSDIDRIDPEFKAKWTAALRSGEYEQGYGALHTLTNEFCCLGVVCDLLELPKEVVTRDSKEVYQYAVNETSTLGHRKSIWFIPGDAFPDYSGFTGQEVLFTCQQPLDHSQVDWSPTILNDVAKLTFSQIADIIDYFL